MFLLLFFSDNASSILSTLFITRWKSVIVSRRTRGPISQAFSAVVGPPPIIRAIILGFLTAGIQVGNNFANAYLVHRHPGYHHVPIVRLALLFCSRPSLNWLPVVVALFPQNFLGEIGKQAVWAYVGWTAAICEAVMQAFGSVSFGVAANLGQQHHFYIPKNLHQYWHGKAAVRMYVGALFWLIGCAVIIPFWIIVAFLLVRLLTLCNHIMKAEVAPVRKLWDLVRLLWTKPKDFIKNRFRASKMGKRLARHRLSESGGAQHGDDLPLREKS